MTASIYMDRALPPHQVCSICVSLFQRGVPQNINLSEVFLPHTLSHES